MPFWVEVKHGGYLENVAGVVPPRLCSTIKAIQATLVVVWYVLVLGTTSAFFMEPSGDSHLAAREIFALDLNLLPILGSNPGGFPALTCELGASR